MALFKTIQEVQEYIPVTISFEFKEIKPFMIEVEREYIIPVIGKAQYESLNTAYNAVNPSLSENETNLLNEIRFALAPLMFYKWFPFGQVKITSSGIQITSTATHKTAFQWQVDKLEESALHSGLLALENILDFLEANENNYDLWKNSEEYTKNKEYVINTAKVFDEYYPINSSRVLFLRLRPFIKIVERESIKKILGNTLYSLVKESLLGDQTISVPVTNETLPPFNFTTSTIELQLSYTNITVGSIVLQYFPDSGDNNTFDFIDNGISSGELIVNGESFAANIDRASGAITANINPTTINGYFQASYSYDTIVEPTDYSDLLEYIRPVAAFGSLFKASVRLSLTINEKGVSLFNNNNSQTTSVLKESSDKRLKEWKLEIQDELEKAKEDLVKFLNENHEDYPDYPYEVSDGTEERFENKSDNKFFYGGK